MLVVTFSVILLTIGILCGAMWGPGDGVFRLSSASLSSLLAGFSYWFWVIRILSRTQRVIPYEARPMPCSNLDTDEAREQVWKWFNRTAARGKDTGWVLLTFGLYLLITFLLLVLFHIPNAIAWASLLYSAGIGTYLLFVVVIPIYYYIRQ